MKLKPYLEINIKRVSINLKIENMKAIKYFFAGVVMLGLSTQVQAQDVKAQIDAITKVVVDNKNNPKAAEPQVKQFVKANKKNPEALAGLGRAYLDIKDQTTR